MWHAIESAVTQDIEVAVFLALVLHSYRDFVMILQVRTNTRQVLDEGNPKLI